jgi:uncharacterized membrane protein YkvA (DUF1232 family)
MAENEERPRRRPRPQDDDAPTPRKRPASRRPRPADDEEPPRAARRRFALDDDDLVGPRRVSAPAEERRAGSGRRDRDVLMASVRELPNFGKLLYRLARDRRVSGFDKGLVVAALAYAAVPADYVPDVIPFVGELDDFVVISLALGRLVNNAGPELLYEHWDGDPESLDSALGVLTRVATLIPPRLRGLLGGVG